MRIIMIQAFGVLVFLSGTLWLMAVIRRADTSGVAENAGRISHALFWLALVVPGTIGLFHPGLTAYDALFGVPRLPLRPVWIGAGIVSLAAGMALLTASNCFLMTRGKGAAAFLLTEHLVTSGVYGITRNPMSLGFYAACAGAGMIAGSLTVTLGVLFIVVPVHLINLKYFEERELELRYGHSYLDYKRRVPFLILRFKRT
jgi:protein-S-isoprenylcysteine O-methyltransferase Ste14